MEIILFTWKWKGLRAGQDQGGPFQQHYVTSLSQG